MCSYSGKVVGVYDGYTVTESRIRPASARFEASQQDGEPSIVGATLDEVLEEISDRAEEKDNR